MTSLHSLFTKALFSSGIDIFVVERTDKGFILNREFVVTWEQKGNKLCVSYGGIQKEYTVPTREQVAYDLADSYGVYKAGAKKEEYDNGDTEPQSPDSDVREGDSQESAGGKAPKRASRRRRDSNTGSEPQS
jgi:hypothetical protein